LANYFWACCHQLRLLVWQHLLLLLLQGLLCPCLAGSSCACCHQLLVLHYHLLLLLPLLS
jgi:hypothetical protein